VLPLLAVAVAACDPVYHVEGTVLDDKGAPIAAATVTKTCPSGRSESATTGVDGRFSFGGTAGAAESAGCSLAVDKAGFKIRTLRTTDACYRSSHTGNAGQPCKSGEGQIVLTR
jgi:hypothetical protein